MSRWPADNIPALIAFYGTPGTAAMERQLVKVVPPFAMYYAGKRIKHLLFHAKAAPYLKAALNDIWLACGQDQAKIDKLEISNTAGTYNPRKIAGSNRWSNHAFAAAFDGKADGNGFGTGKGTISPILVAAFKRYGARWGGDYTGRTDPMHVEFAGGGEMPILPQGFFGAEAFEDYEGEPHVNGCVMCEPESEGHEGPHNETSVVTVDGSRAERADEIQDSAESDAETRGSWFKRKWRKLSGAFTGVGGVGVMGWLYDPWVIVAIGGVLIVFVILFVWFMGPGNVRAWIRKQVS
jgi:D-alanyl-D-alanine carboxypeptidase-like protein